MLPLLYTDKFWFGIPEKPALSSQAAPVKHHGCQYIDTLNAVYNRYMHIAQELFNVYRESRQFLSLKFPNAMRIHVVMKDTAAGEKYPYQLRMNLYERI